MTRHLAFRQIALFATVLAIINFLGAPAILLCSWIGVTGALIPVGATSVMVLTLALQVAFVAVQAFKDGRTPIPIRMMGHDAWLTIIIMTALPGVLWHYLAAVALPPMQLILPGYATPLVNVVILVFAREAQQRRSARIRV